MKVIIFTGTQPRHLFFHKAIVDLGVDYFSVIMKRENLLPTTPKNLLGQDAKNFDKQYELDIIGTSHCRSRTIACTEQEFQVFQMFKQTKARLIVCHQKWIDSITKQCEAMKTGLKAYRYLSEGVELMTELGVNCDEAELIRTNSTGLVIYNPVNLASMIKGMKNTTITREQKIAIRKAYEANKIN